MKVLVLLSRVPYPLEKGDKLRAFNQIKWLARDHQVVLCCLNDLRLHPDALKVLKPICAEIMIIRIHRLFIFFRLVAGLFSQKPLQVHYFYSKRAQKIIDRLIEKHLPKHLYCQLVRIAEYARKYTVLTKTLDYMDALSTGAERRIQGAPFYLRPLLRLEARRLITYESMVYNDFQHHTIISLQDRELIHHTDKNNISIIPNGVDMEFFQPRQQERQYDLLFTGNMSYPPNVRAARYIVKSILPLLIAQRPNLRVLIAGASPAPTVKSLQSEQVHISGWVEDIRDCYAQSRILIAPMQIGTGLQNKLLEGMAMQLPCITSALANNALQAPAGRAVLIGNSPEEYAQLVLTLLDDPSLFESISHAGYQFVKQHYNWQQTTNQLQQLMKG